MQQYQSQLQQDLVDLSLSNALSIAKLDCIRIKSKMPFTFQLIVGSKQLHQRTPQQFLVDVWFTNAISNHGPNQHESSCASLLAAHAKCLNSHESSCASLLAVRAKCLSHESGCASLLAARVKSLKSNEAHTITPSLSIKFIGKSI